MKARGFINLMISRVEKSDPLREALEWIPQGKGHGASSGRNGLKSQKKLLGVDNFKDRRTRQK